MSSRTSLSGPSHEPLRRWSDSHMSAVLFFFCFCFVLFLQLSTMNFLPRDGLVQIKMTGIIKRFFNVQRCGLS